MVDKRLLAVPLLILVAVSALTGPIVIKAEVPSEQQPEFSFAIPDPSRRILPDLGGLRDGPLRCGTWYLVIPPRCIGARAAVGPGPTNLLPVQPSPIPR